MALSPSSTMLCAYLALAPRRAGRAPWRPPSCSATAPSPRPGGASTPPCWRLRSEVRPSTGVDIVGPRRRRASAWRCQTPSTSPSTRLGLRRLLESVLRRRPEDLAPDQVDGLEHAVGLHRGAPRGGVPRRLGDRPSATGWRTSTSPRSTTSSSTTAPGRRRRRRPVRRDRARAGAAARGRARPPDDAYGAAGRTDLVESAVRALPPAARRAARGRPDAGDDSRRTPARLPVTAPAPCRPGRARLRARACRREVARLGESVDRGLGSSCATSPDRWAAPTRP